MHSPRSLLALLLGASLEPQGAMTAHPRIRRNLLMILLTVGVTLDLVIGLALGYVAVEARSASNQAHIIKVATYEACILNNEAKRADLRRWQDVLVLVKDGSTDPKTLNFVQAVARSNQTADAPRDCGKLAP